MTTRADLDAHQSWAACGQTAVAALLRRPLGDIRHAVPEGRTWMSHKDMRETLAKLGVRERSTGYEAERGDTRTPPCKWPMRGLAWIQFRGPWEADGIPRAASLRHSHWIAVAPVTDSEGRPTPGYETEPFVFDVHTAYAGWNGGWMPRSWWENRILAPLIACHKQATGGWWVRAGIEVAT